MNTFSAVNIALQIRTPACLRARMHARASVQAAIRQQAHDMMSYEVLDKIAGLRALSTAVSVASPARQFVYEYFNP